MQGLFELTGIPYVGCDVEASAIAMDKVISKRVAASVNVPVLADNWLSKSEWIENRSAALKKAMQGLSYPVFVKPVHLGSSIAIGKAEKKSELEDALDVAFHYETKVMVEEALRVLSLGQRNEEEQGRKQAAPEPGARMFGHGFSLRTGKRLGAQTRDSRDWDCAAGIVARFVPG